MLFLFSNSIFRPCARTPEKEKENSNKNEFYILSSFWGREIQYDASNPNSLYTSEFSPLDDILQLIHHRNTFGFELKKRLL